MTADAPSPPNRVADAPFPPNRLANESLPSGSTASHAHLNDSRGSPVDHVGWQSAERTALHAHQGQTLAQGQLVGQGLEVGVVVQIELLQVL